MEELLKKIEEDNQMPSPYSKNPLFDIMTEDADDDDEDVE